MMAVIATTPPTVPPTMGPTGTEFFGAFPISILYSNTKEKVIGSPRTSVVVVELVLLLLLLVVLVVDAPAEVGVKVVKGIAVAGTTHLNFSYEF